MLLRNNNIMCICLQWITLHIYNKWRPVADQKATRLSPLAPWTHRDLVASDVSLCYADSIDVCGRMNGRRGERYHLAGSDPDELLDTRRPLPCRSPARWRTTSHASGTNHRPGEWHSGDVHGRSQSVEAAAANHARCPCGHRCSICRHADTRIPDDRRRPRRSCKW